MKTEVFFGWEHSNYTQWCDSTGINLNNELPQVKKSGKAFAVSHQFSQYAATNAYAYFLYYNKSQLKHTLSTQTANRQVKKNPQ